MGYKSNFNSGLEVYDRWRPGNDLSDPDGFLRRISIRCRPIPIAEQVARISLPDTCAPTR